MNPADFGKVAVLMGGDSAEREISLMSGHGVLNALRARHIDAYAFDPAEQALHTLKNEGYARCFIALHGPGGEDGSLQGALEYLQIPYTGPGVMASSIAMDKIMTKRVWSSANVPTPPYIVLEAQDQPTEDELTRIVNTLGLPLIVKPPHEGSSLGVSKVTEKAQLAQAIRNARMYEPTVLCESFIVGDEYTCAILGEGAQARALPLIRIVAPEGSYDYQNKYFTDVVRYECPCGLPAEEEQRIQAIALNAYRALGCRGWSRIDLMLDNATRQPYLLEANTAPGMTSHSLVPRAAQAVGISYEDLCSQILASATLER